MLNYLKCDEPGCDHREFIGDLTRDLIGKPCPKCGANLLTKSDYKLGRRVGFMLKVMRFFGMVKEANPDGSIPAGYESVDINPHNNKVTIKEKTS